MGLIETTSEGFKYFWKFYDMIWLLYLTMPNDNRLYEQNAQTSAKKLPTGKMNLILERI